MGHTFLIPSGTSERPDLKHLHIVCSEPCDKGNVVLVSVTGWTNNLCDATTRLETGCHSWVIKDSYCFYRKCRIEPVASIEKALHEGEFVGRDPMPNPPLQQIIDGIIASPQTSWKVKKYLKR